MFAIGNEELGKLPRLGKTIKCPHCGKEHEIEHSISESGVGLLQFYKCGENVYLAGIEGKALK